MTHPHQNPAPFGTPPYQPHAQPPVVADGIKIEEVKGGQKYFIYAILIDLGAIAARYLVPEEALPPIVLGVILIGVYLTACALALIGMWRVGTGLGWSGIVKVLLVLGLFVPYLNILLMLVVNSKATSALTKAGYKVGLMGASEVPVR